MRRTTAIVAVLLLFLAPLLVLLGMRLMADELEALDPPPEAVITAPEIVVESGEQLVTVSLDWSTPREVGAPDWAGRVTDVLLTPPAALNTGTKVIAIDGVARVAAATDRPFTTSLTRGDVGTDIVMLQRLLSSLGYLEDSVDGRFGLSTLNAVKAFARDLGVVKPSGAFDSGWVIWIPTEGFEVQRIEAKESFAAPASGSLLLIEAQHLVAVGIWDEAGQPLDLRGEWDLRYGEHTLRMRNGTATAEQLQMFGSVLEAGEMEVRGMVSLSTPLESLRIPPTAVLAGNDGTLCVLVADGDDFEEREVIVESGAAGATYVRKGLAAGERVLVNPAQMFESPTCH